MECENIEAVVYTRLFLPGMLLRIGDHRLPNIILLGELENVGQRGPGGKEEENTDCEAEDRRVFGITGDGSTTT